MKPSEDFFAGNRYAIFGAKAKGRAHGDVLIGALNKAGKSAVAIQADGVSVKNADVSRSLAEAGSVDGAVLLPPSPWDSAAAEFMVDAARQCKAQGMNRVWIYTAGDSAEAIKIAQAEGLDPSTSACPCLYIQDGGFPHGFHRFIAKLLKQI
ncbi:MAG: CoA-binding protein [Armatimonadota bacterium]